MWPMHSAVCWPKQSLFDLFCVCVCVCVCVCSICFGWCCYCVLNIPGVIAVLSPLARQRIIGNNELFQSLTLTHTHAFPHRPHPSSQHQLFINQSMQTKPPSCASPDYQRPPCSSSSLPLWSLHTASLLLYVSSSRSLPSPFFMPAPPYLLHFFLTTIFLFSPSTSSPLLSLCLSLLSSFPFLNRSVLSSLPCCPVLSPPPGLSFSPRHSPSLSLLLLFPLLPWIPSFSPLHPFPSAITVHPYSPIYTFPHPPSFLPLSTTCYHQYFSFSSLYWYDVLV